MRRFVTVIAAVSLGGCSALLMEHPESDYRRSEIPQCSAGRGPVVLDVVLGLLAGAGGVGLISADEGAAGVLGVLTGAAFGGSALKGVSSSRTCAERRRRYQALPHLPPEGGGPGRVAREEEPAGETAENDEHNRREREASDGKDETDAPDADEVADPWPAERPASAPDTEVFWDRHPRAGAQKEVARGIVVHLEEGEMYFNLGGGDGPAAGDPVRIKHPVELPHPRRADPVKDWLPVGASRVQAVGEELSMARLGQELAAKVEVGDVVEVLVQAEEPAREGAGEGDPDPEPAKEAPEPLPELDEETETLLETFASVADRSAAVRAAAWERYLATHPETAYADAIRKEIELLRREAEELEERELEPTGPAVGGLEHRAPAEVDPDEPLDLVFVIDEPDDLLAAWLHYRRRGEERYRKGRLRREGGRYLRGELPAPEVGGEAMEYFVEVVSRERGVGYGAGSPEAPLAVGVDQPDFDEVFGEQRNRSRVSVTSLYLDYATFDDRGGNRADNVFLFESDFFYRLYETIYGVRAGFGVLRGQGGFADDTDPEAVGFNFGYSELEIRGPEQLSLIGRLIAGVGEEGFGLGFAGRVRLGREDATYLSLGFQDLAEIGFLSDIRMQWAALPKFPLGLSAAVTNQPADGDLGVRLTSSVGWRAVSWMQPTLYLSYQGRSVVHSGVGGGFGVVFDW